MVEYWNLTNMVNSTMDILEVTNQATYGFTVPVMFILVPCIIMLMSSKREDMFNTFIVASLFAVVSSTLLFIASATLVPEHYVEVSIIVLALFVFFKFVKGGRG